MDSKFKLGPKVINGGIAGIVGVSVVFPIDLAKTRLQNQQTGPNGERMYKGLVDCFIKTIRGEGLRGMYRGSFVNLVLITPEKAIKLVANDGFRHALGERINKKLSLSREVLAGAGAGTCQIIITTPMELLKIQLQDSGRTAAKKIGGAGVLPTSSVFNSVETTTRSLSTVAQPVQKITARQVAFQLLREKGPVGLYKGFASTWLRDVTFSMIYFPLFANLNKLGKRRPNSNEAVFYHSLLSGCIAGGVASFAANPFDVVKTRLQTINKAQGEMTYSGIPDCFRKTYQHEGIQAFFKGAVCRIAVIAPLFGIAQTVYYLGVAEFMIEKLGNKVV